MIMQSFVIDMLLCSILFESIPIVLTLPNLHIGFVIFSQENEYHQKVSQEKEMNLLQQSKALNQSIKLFKSSEILDNNLGHWTVFPLLEKISTFQLHWVIFLEDITEVNLSELLKVFAKYNSSEAVFVGYALKDNEPTIIHHFADPDNILYPHFSLGFFISSHLIKSLVFKVPQGNDFSFSIDPKFELAKFIWNNGNGSKLQHEAQFCLARKQNNCATWIKEEFPKCGLPVSSKHLSIAVKTCYKFHKDRIPVVKRTWASDAKNVAIFSDVEDSSIPTVNLGIKNVPHGHCEKTLSIMKYYIKNKISFLWLAIVDDDTLISIPRLQKLLACYNASRTVAIGERYGYGVTDGTGYDYITGGGGMIFSLQTIKMIVQFCYCPSVDSPDDMIIGMCLRRLSIPVIHSPYFHQARPDDYATDFLLPFKHISFHKHWMVNPVEVYTHWLKDKSANDLHNEL